MNKWSKHVRGKEYKIPEYQSVQSTLHILSLISIIGLPYLKLDTLEMQVSASLQEYNAVPL